MSFLGRPPTNAPLTSADIPDGIIVAADLAPDSVDSSELVDGSIDTSHIGANQVTAAKVAADVATQAELDTVSTVASAALPKAGGPMTGNIVMADDTSIGIADDAERIEFDGAGDISILGANLGVGTAAPATELHIFSSGVTELLVETSGADQALTHYKTSATSWSVGQQGGDSGNFKISNATSLGSSEAITINTSEYVGIGVYPSYRFHVAENRADWGFKFSNSNSSSSGLLVHAATGNNSSFQLNPYDGGSAIFYVQGDGDFNFAGSDISDERLKENIVDCEHGLAEVLQLTPRRFNFKEHSDITKHGWIAQEVELVMSNMVRGDGSLPVDGGGKMSMDYAGMSAVLCKAVQELSAKNDALETTVATLEAVENDSSSSNAALEARIIALEAA